MLDLCSVPRLDELMVAFRGCQAPALLHSTHDASLLKAETSETVLDALAWEPQVAYTADILGLARLHLPESLAASVLQLLADYLLHRHRESQPAIAHVVSDTRAGQSREC